MAEQTPRKMPQITPRGQKIMADTLLGVGGGVGGFVKGMTHSPPAQAAVVDETQTRAYQQAQAAVQAGQGDTPTRSGSLWHALMKTGSTPNQTIDAAHQRQQAMDEALRQPGKPAFSEQRKLNDMRKAKGM